MPIGFSRVLNRSAALVRSPLTRAVTFWVFFSIIVIEAIILVPSYFGERGRFLNNIAQEGRVIAKVIARSDMGKVPAADRSERLSQLVSGTRIVGLMMAGVDGGTIATFGELPTLVAGGEVTRFEDQANGVFDVAFRPEDLSAGVHVVLRLHTDGVDQHLNAFVIRILGLVAIIVGFVGVTTVLAVVRVVLWPLAIIRESLDGRAEFPVERRDEFGDVARALAEKRAQQQAMDMAREQREEIERRERLTAIATEVEGGIRIVLSELSSDADVLCETADRMHACARETTSLTNLVSEASAQASSNVATVAAAAEELSASIEEIRRQVDRSANVAAEANAEALRTNDLVGGLQTAAQRIGTVVNIITEIAGRTNLLALNASIEAARAGEAGRGFAIVAGEVKTLAGQTAKATGEITDQVNSIRVAVDEAVEAIRSVASTVGNISAIADDIASAIEQQNEATREIARNVTQASASTRGVLDHVAQVAGGVSETDDAANCVLDVSTKLNEGTVKLEREVERLLRHIRDRSGNG